MSISEQTISIRGINVQVVRKAIKNLHLGVYPPNGRVRVAAPLHLTDDNVRLAVITRLDWIKKQRAQFEAQPRQSERQMIPGETHYIWGRRYRLDIIERPGKREVHLKNGDWLQLSVPAETSLQARKQLLQDWYRAELKSEIPPLLAKWQPIIGEEVAEWGVKRMKTKWGSCNIQARRIWFNLELAKKPYSCLEYIVVHEMVHFLERHHNDRFRAYMTKFLPHWQSQRKLLNSYPLSHEQW